MFRPLFRVVLARQNVEPQRAQLGGRGELHHVGRAVAHGAIHAHFVFRDGELRVLRAGDFLRAKRRPFLRGEKRFRRVIDLRPQPSDLAIESLRFGKLCGIHRHAQPGKIVAHVRVLGTVEQREKAVVVLVLERVIRMRVALHATEGRPLPHRPRRVHAIDDRREPELFVVRAALGVRLRVAVKPRRHAVGERRLRQHIAGELLHRELIERHVRIQRAHQPVAPRPDLATAILFVALRVRVAREIHPQRRPALAEMRRREQPIRDLLMRLLSAGESGEFLRRRRQPREVECHAPLPLRAVRLARRLHAFVLDLREDETIRVAPSPSRILHHRHRLQQRLHEGPVLAPFRALGDPLPQRRDLLFRERLSVAVIRRRHPLVLVRGSHAHDHLRLLRLPRHDRLRARLPLGERLLAINKRHAARLLHPAVAARAVRVQDRADITIEIRLRLRGNGERERGGENRSRFERAHARGYLPAAQLTAFFSSVW